MKKKLIVLALLIASGIFGLLQQLVWRMDGSPQGPNGNNLAQGLGFELPYENKHLISR
jgi:hypothetical protein